MAGKVYNWNKYGPRMFDVLERLVQCPLTGKGSESMWDRISAANALVQEMEESGFSQITGKEDFLQ